MKIPVPLFEPDRTPYLFSSGDNLVNCLPVQDGWGPMPSFSEQSAALAADCKGAALVIDDAGNVEIFAGTSTKLYRMNTTSVPYTWDDLTRSSGGNYSVPSDDTWQFAVFGDVLIACQLGDAPQVYTIGSGSPFADLSGAPTSKHVWVAGDFLVFGWQSGEPNGIRWSGINDHTHWTIGRKGSDLQIWPDGGGVQAGIGDRRGAIIAFKNKFRIMNFAPSSGWTFTTADINAARGTISANSLVQIRDRDFVYLSEDGFFRGVEAQPIGAHRVDSWLQENIDLSLIEEVQGEADPFNKIVWWRFTQTDTTSALIGYDWQLDRWCYSDSDVTYLAKVASPGVTIDGLDSYYSTIDDIDIPFDSRFFTGGRPAFGAFTSDNKLAFASGASQQATIRSPLIELTEERRSCVKGFRMETDAATATGRIGKIFNFGDAPTYTDSLSMSSRGKRFHKTVSGRLHSFEGVIPAGENWTTVSNFRPDFVPEGHL